jgi:hypothetical protein
MVKPRTFIPPLTEGIHLLALRYTPIFCAGKIEVSYANFQNLSRISLGKSNSK